MRRRMFASKIHRATVPSRTSTTRVRSRIDQDLLDTAGILEWEEVHIWDVTNGARLRDLRDLRASRVPACIGINGAAAHLIHPGDIVILATFVELDDAEAREHTPTAVFVDGDNRVKELRAEVVSV